MANVPISKTKGYFAQAKRDQRERDRSAGVCIIRRKANPFPDKVQGEGCAGVARPGKATCQFCSDVEYHKTQERKNRNSSVDAAPG